ncbi:MAG: YhgE/Pip family protein, partial [Acidaminobacteraceae bacterium]
VSNNSLASGLSNDAVEGLDKITDGSHQLKKNMPKFEGAVTLLSKYSGYLNQNVEKLNEKVPDLEQGMALIDDNVVKLNSGVLKLHGASEKMLEGAKELNEKVPDLQIGIELIGEGSSKIEDGIIKLHSASGTLNDGVATLNSKMPDLIDGVNAIYDGTGTLASQLSEGSDKIADAVVVDGNAMSAYIANPVVVESNAIFGVENYGTGFSPYFIALALWVGALTMFFIIPDTRKEGDSARDYIFGKYFTYATVGIIQAVILSIVILAIGLKPTNYIIYFMFNIMLSLVFIAIMQCLIYLFADAGRLGATIFLLLQLTSSGGTFSVELVPMFFQKVSPFMPFTYAVNGLREIISGINNAVLFKSTFVLVMIQVLALLALYFGINYKDKLEKIKANKSEENLSPATD